MLCSQSQSQDFVIACVKDIMDGLSPSVLSVFAVIGGLYVARCTLYVIGSFYETFLRPAKNLKKYGAWAVVTGATGERWEIQQILYSTVLICHTENIAQQLRYVFMFCILYQIGLSIARDARIDPALL